MYSVVRIPQLSSWTILFTTAVQFISSRHWIVSDFFFLSFSTIWQAENKPDRVLFFFFFLPPPSFSLLLFLLQSNAPFVCLIATCVGCFFLFSPTGQCWMNADINTHVQVRRDRQARQTDRETERRTGREGGNTVSSWLHGATSSENVSPSYSLIFTGKKKLRVIPPPPPDVENESCCPTGSEGWVSKFKVLLIRFHQFSPSQFLKHWKRSEKLFLPPPLHTLSKVKSLSVNVSSGRRKEEKVAEMHKGEEIGRKEGARRLGTGRGFFFDCL